MRILHLAPLWFPVARSSSGGIETFLASLIEEQLRQGCEVALIASGDSDTGAELVAATPTNVVDAMAAGTTSEYAYHEQQAMSLALDRMSEFDIVHSHLGTSALALSSVPDLHGRLLHTHHNEITPDLITYIARNPDVWISTVSHTSAAPLRRAGATRCYVVPNGITGDAFAVGSSPGKGLAFLGRMERAKGADTAIAVARETGRQLTMGGPIVDDDFFANEIQPFLGRGVRYVGVLDHEAKCALFASSACTLVPSRAEEGFGMVAVESMACGTPVVSSGSGALSEVVEDGLTGFSTDSRTMAEAVERAVALDRHTVATRARERFGIRRAAHGYLALYERAERATAVH
ncbi:MAG TPA: glycosyltransferase [Acidimicrobiales bacterium]